MKENKFNKILVAIFKLILDIFKAFFKFLIEIRFILTGLILLFILISFSHKIKESKFINSLFNVIKIADPKVISYGCDDSTSTLFEYSVVIKGSIRNEGGDGNIVIEAILYQGTKNLKKTEKYHISEFETIDFRIVFDEAELLGDKISCTVSTYAVK